MRSLILAIVALSVLGLSACTSMHHKKNNLKYCGVSYAEDHKILNQIQKAEKKRAAAKRKALVRKFEVSVNKVHNFSFLHKTQIAPKQPIRQPKNIVRKAIKVESKTIAKNQLEAKVAEQKRLQVSPMTDTHTLAGHDCFVANLNISEGDRLAALMFIVSNGVSEISIFNSESQEIIGLTGIVGNDAFLVAVNNFAGKTISVKIKTAESAKDSSKVKLLAYVLLKDNKLEVNYIEKEFTIKIDTPKPIPKISPPIGPPVRTSVHHSSKNAKIAKVLCSFILLTSTGGAALLLRQSRRKNKKLKEKREKSSLDFYRKRHRSDLLKS